MYKEAKEEIDPQNQILLSQPINVLLFFKSLNLIMLILFWFSVQEHNITRLLEYIIHRAIEDQFPELYQKLLKGMKILVNDLFNNWKSYTIGEQL